jgi:hypothetical protein
MHGAVALAPDRRSHGSALLAGQGVADLVMPGSGIGAHGDTLILVEIQFMQSVNVQTLTSKS